MDLDKQENKKKIGILGGTFDPAHKGHLSISKEAKRRYDIDKIIWAVTKKNPFKDKSSLSLDKRINFAKKIAQKNLFIKVKYFEDKIKSNRTIDLIKYIKRNNKTWSKEHLSSKISVKLVNNINDAVNHINKYGTMHTDAIITNNKISAKYFIKNIKSSIAIHNSSTQYADGGEFGFGGEVGISTNKLPPRGPVGLNQLVSYKYEIYGSGQTRK